MNAFWSGERSRKIVERIVIEGDFVLRTPAHFGSGDSRDPQVMELLTDAADPSAPLLPGASLAGALRAYLWMREVGDVDPETLQGHEYYHMLTISLFGGLRADDDGTQSRLIVDDSVGEYGTRIERDGVGLNPHSRTAAENFVYRTELWGVGTCFPLRFELLIYAGDDGDGLRRALAATLSGLNDGAITLGARKRRGCGRGQVEVWRARRFDLRSLDGSMEWLRYGNAPLTDAEAHTDIFSALDTEDTFARASQQFEIDARFTLEGSILIRSFDVDYTDMRHLHSAGQPVLSGTSLAGALRARASKILRTLGADNQRHDRLMEGVFGSRPRQVNETKTKLRGSRLTIEEHLIRTSAPERVQSRVSIDRFTGGALDTALFTQQPVFQSDERGVRVRLWLRQPKDHEIGLLLLLLKDLWTGDLALGGEQSVGRGRLHGDSATLTLGEKRWSIQRSGQDGLTVTDAEGLNPYLAQLRGYLKRSSV